MLKESIAALVIVAALAGCGGGGSRGNRDVGTLPLSPPIYTRAEAEQRAKWTVLVYLDADNDLETAGIHNFNQMEIVGSTQDVHVIVQMDRMRAVDPDNDKWTDTRRYLITRDNDALKMHSIRLDSPPLNELDMADPATLRSFVQWGMNEFPADHYLLVIWDHGTGWQMRSTSVTSRYKFVAADDTSSTVLNVTSIPSALAGMHMDVIAFDACYMQQLEVAYEMRNCADYLVGSTAIEPSPGYNYDRLLCHIDANTQPEQLCQVVVEQYAAEYPNPTPNITHSAIDLRKIGSVAEAMNSFAGMLQTSPMILRPSLASARSETLNYSTTGSSRYSLDLLDYVSRCADVMGPSANSTCANLQNAFNDAMIASIHNADMPNAQGLAIYIPPTSRYESIYGETSLAQDTDWDEWLRSQ